MSTYKAVYLDLDGTVLDTINDVFIAVNRTLERFGHEHTTFNRFMELAHMPIGDIFSALLDGSKNPSNHAEIVNSYSEEYAASCTVTTKPYDGMRELLSGLAAMDIKLGIITNKDLPVSEIVMNAFFPDIPFAFIIGAAPCYRGKPDRHMGDCAIEITGIPAEHTLYIGDSATDMRFANAVGFKAVAASWGYNPVEVLLKNGAEYTINAPLEILELI